MSMTRVDLVLCTENAFKMSAFADNEFIFILLVIDAVLQTV